MMYLTDRKRARGHGSAHQGTEHHWNMTLSSAALLILIPLFVFTFGFALGLPYEEARAYYARPVPATIAAMTILVSMIHFRGGFQTLIEDYTGGDTRKLVIMGGVIVSYGLAALALVSIARIAL
ncbi:MAG: succinate dehydrogenase, hydrophobic membrane anchor protein [Pseudomonadota bacterium]